MVHMSQLSSLSVSDNLSQAQPVPSMQACLCSMNILKCSWLRRLLLWCNHHALLLAAGPISVARLHSLTRSRLCCCCRLAAVRACTAAVVALAAALNQLRERVTLAAAVPYLPQSLHLLQPPVPLQTFWRYAAAGAMPGPCSSFQAAPLSCKRLEGGLLLFLLLLCWGRWRLALLLQLQADEQRDDARQCQQCTNDKRGQLAPCCVL